MTFSPYDVGKAKKALLSSTLRRIYAEQSAASSNKQIEILGPDVQSIVSLTSSLMVKMLTVLVSTISNSQVFLLIKCE